MKTMLDKCAVAGDITQAIDRRGAWSCAITVIGGTESTAVKLQSCETADGIFEDFKTLIPSAEASASQYKGFVVDISGAKNFIKVVGATMATCVLGDCDADVKKVAIKAGEIPSGADLEDNKTATINVSTYENPVEVTPTSGKDGMKKATITLSNIPSVAHPTLYRFPVNYVISEGDIGPVQGDLAVSDLSSISVGDKLFVASVTYELNEMAECTAISDSVITFVSGEDSNEHTYTIAIDAEYTDIMQF